MTVWLFNQLWTSAYILLKYFKPLYSLNETFSAATKVAGLGVEYFPLEAEGVPF
jgi:hypothetical protein